MSIKFVVPSYASGESRLAGFEARRKLEASLERDVVGYQSEFLAKYPTFSVYDSMMAENPSRLVYEGRDANKLMRIVDAVIALSATGARNVILQGNSKDEVLESIALHQFKRDHGLSVELHMQNTEYGYIEIAPAGAVKLFESRKLAFSVNYSPEMAEDAEGRKVEVEIVHLRLMPKAARSAPQLNALLKETAFVKSDAVGLVCSTGYTTRDLEDKGLLMKTGILPVSVITECKGTQPVVKPQGPDQDLSLR